MDTLLNSGDILNSRYRILHQIGHGGFGRTYLAEDINRFNERCVLKEFAPQLQGSFALEKAQELFEREAGILYRLKHPQIPKFRELFRYKHQEKGHLLLVQDYVDGQTYHSLFNNRSQQGIKFTEAEISQLFSQLLPVLDYIHSLGVIHRDISPDNLMLRSSDGLAILIDFGSIKEVATRAQSELKVVSNLDPLSFMGTVLGKNGYAPPEQMERGVVHPHSDLYALAATALVLLTGKKPQQLITAHNHQWHWQEEIVLSSKWEWILNKMLAPIPRDRFNSATEVLEILEDSNFTCQIPPIALPASASTISNQPSPTKLRQLMLEYFRSRLLSKLPLLATLTATIFLGAFWFLQQQNLTFLPDPFFTSSNSVEAESQFFQRFSQGERILISPITTPEKELAVAKFAQSNYQEAAVLLLASLKIMANDPEALIYLNNARIGQKKAYHIAVSVPIGSNVNAAQEILRGVAQAQNQVNQAGGINGIPLKITIINDDDRPKVAQQVAQSISQNQEILGVLGHYASDVTLATASIYESGQLVSISPTSTSVKLSNLSPYLFRATPSDYVAARALAEYMIEELKQKNVAVFYNSQSNYSQSLKSEFITAVSLGGGRVVSIFDLSDANFSAANSFDKALSGGAEVLMLAANTGTLDKALQVVQVNRQRLSLLGGDDIYTPKTLRVAGEFAEDMTLVIPWHFDSKPKDEFTRVTQELWQGEVNWRTAMAYDAASALIAAIEHNPTRKGVQKVLSHPNFSAVGAGDKINFLPSGDRLKSMELVKVQSTNSNSFGYEFTPVVAKSK